MLRKYSIVYNMKREPKIIRLKSTSDRYIKIQPRMNRQYTYTSVNERSRQLIKCILKPLKYTYRIKYTSSNHLIIHFEFSVTARGIYLLDDHYNQGF